MSKRALFITGATGFVGSFVARRLKYSPVFANIPIFVLARGIGNIRAKERIQRSIPGFEGHVVDGDITSGPVLGISKENIFALKKYDLEVWHIAGDTSFAEEKRESIFSANVDGTMNVLNFMNAMRSSRIHYMSTAYIAGVRPILNDDGNIVYENEDWMQQRFRNPYEESKLKAEMLIRDRARTSDLMSSIYRIGIVVGDSTTGVTLTYSGYYSCMRALKAMCEKIGNKRIKGKGRIFVPVRIEIGRDATVNIGCIDYIADTIVRIAECKESIGKTFHVVNPDPPRSGWLIENSLRIMGIDGVKCVDTKTSSKNDERQIDSAINKAFEYYSGYVFGEPVFDATNVKKILGAVPLHPKVDEDLLIRLLEPAMATNFSRKHDMPV